MWVRIKNEWRQLYFGCIEDLVDIKRDRFNLIQDGVKFFKEDMEFEMNNVYDYFVKKLVG